MSPPGVHSAVGSRSTVKPEQDDELIENVSYVLPRRASRPSRCIRAYPRPGLEV